MSDEAKKGNNHFSHFGPQANLLQELETVFRDFGETGTGKTRHYVHDEAEEKLYGTPPGTFSEWEDISPETEVLFYEGLHGAVVTDNINVAQHCDLKIGVVPVVNLEWIQKIHRDKMDRGLLPRGHQGHHPAPDARLPRLYLPAVFANRYQLPEGAYRGYIQCLHCALDSHSG